jgi:hypothetical protein
VRLTRALCGIAMVAALGGCTGDEPAPTGVSAPAPTGVPAPAPTGVSAPASAPAWAEPANYVYVADRRCEGGTSEGRYRVTVEGGKVAAVDRVDGRTASGEEEIDLPTLGGLLDLARTAADDGGEMSTSADPRDGHPTGISFDVSDGPTCFIITDYQPR